LPFGGAYDNINTDAGEIESIDHGKAITRQEEDDVKDTLVKEKVF